MIVYLESTVSHVQGKILSGVQIEQCHHQDNNNDLISEWDILISR
jgi:hypothetical protein